MDTFHGILSCELVCQSSVLSSGIVMSGEPELRRIQYQNDFDLFSTAIATTYLSQVYFEIPVLDTGPLSRACQGGRAFYPPDHIIHHALFASTARWLDPELLERQGYADLYKALEVSFQKLEVCPAACRRLVLIYQGSDLSSYQRLTSV